MLPAPYRQLREELAAFLPTERLIDDPLRLLTWGTDASFYRLVPKLVVVVESETERRRVLAALRAAARRRSRSAPPARACRARRSATRCWSCSATTGAACEVGADGATITLQPGVIGAAANRGLAPFGRKIGPDPASIDAAMIGGIAANNASGMCCGTAQNSYHTLAGMRVVLADGTVLDTRDADESRGVRARSARSSSAGWPSSRATTRDDAALAARIRHKFRHQEHHRLQPERAGRFQRPGRHPRPPDDRLGGHARLHQRDHLPHGPRARRTRRAR